MTIKIASMGLPEDQFLLRECKNRRQFTSYGNDSVLLDWLCDFVIRTIKPRRLRPRELAEMVDFLRVRSDISIELVAEVVRFELGDTHTVGTIVQAYKNHGLRIHDVLRKRSARKANIQVGEGNKK